MYESLSLFLSLFSFWSCHVWSLIFKQTSFQMQARITNDVLHPNFIRCRRFYLIQNACFKVVMIYGCSWSWNFRCSSFSSFSWSSSRRSSCSSLLSYKWSRRSCHLDVVEVGLWVVVGVVGLKCCQVVNGVGVVVLWVVVVDAVVVIVVGAVACGDGGDCVDGGYCRWSRVF